MQTTAEKIVEYIKQRGRVTGAEMADYVGITRQAIFRHLTNLLNSGKITKIGKPPKVFYLINTIITPVKNFEIDKHITEQINENFLIITPTGERKEGVAGFVYWCDKNNLPYEKTATEYARTLQKYDAFKKDGLISGLEKLRATFPQVYLDEIFYLDFYSIERFGKTKLGQLLLYAKQSQSLPLMKEIITIIKPKIDEAIKKFKINGIGYIPPTVKRERQLMRVLEKGLNENIKTVSIVKIKTDVAVPQKTLSKLEDRIENAKDTMVVDENGNFENILLVDDAVGSGATFNEVAKKIRERNICQGKIIGLALTGSYKGFDVISEV